MNKTLNPVAVICVGIATILGVTGCATSTPKVAVAPTPRAALAPRPAAVKVDIARNAQKTLETLQTMPATELYNKYLDLSTKELIDFDTLMKRLKDAQVIYIGEAHTNPAHHALQLKVLEHVHKNNAKTAFAMEFLYRSSQPLLDNYVAGKISDEEFDSKTAFGFGTFHFAYKTLMRYAKNNNIKLLGLNVERQIKRKMADNGWDNLSDTEKKLIAKDVDLENPGHRQYVMAQLKQLAGSAGHQAGDEMLEKMYYLQTMWDETMGESISNYLKKEPDKRSKVVAIAGKSHIEYKFNVPERAYKRYPAQFKTLVPVMINSRSRVDFAKLMDSKLGDFIFFSDFR